MIYWAVKTIKSRNTLNLLQEGKKIIADLIGFYQPDLIVQEKIFYTQAKSSERLVKLYSAIKRLAKRKGLSYIEYAPITVRKHICQDGWSTKKETAKIVVSLYPELAVNLNPNRVWKEKYWGYMFDAVALGVCCCQNLPKDKSARISF